MSFVGSGQQANTATGTTCTITYSGPTINAGDILLFCFSVSSTTYSATFPSGAAAVSGLTNLSPQSANGGDQWGFQWKVAVGGETSFAFSNSFSGWLSAYVRVYRGRTATPFTVTPVTTAVVATAPSPLSISLTGLTPNAGDDVVAIIPMGTLGNANAWNLTSAPSGFANVDNFTSPLQNQNVLCACDSVGWAGGATGTLTGTITSAGGYNMGYGGWVLTLAASSPGALIDGRGVGCSPGISSPC